MPKPLADLGVQDPELRNSPVAWEADEDAETLRESMPGAAVCYFNDHAYENGTMVRTGTTVLRCDHGVWVPEVPELGA